LLAFGVLALGISACAPSPRFAGHTGAGGQKSGGTSSGGFSLVEQGDASYYADDFNGKKTANGETYNMNDLTAAHRTLPFNTKVKVTNTLNSKSVVVRINDRGPFKADRLIDLSLEAAKELDMIGPGTAKVQLEVVELGSGN
jgi:rare lipoprotein A